MQNLVASTSLSASALSGPGSAASAHPAAAKAPGKDSGKGFGAALGAALSDDRGVTVRRGDTLTGLVKAQFRQQGVAVSEGRAWQMALQVARDNGIANPDRVEPGQQMQLQGVRQTVDQLASLSPGERVVGPLPAWRPPTVAASPASTTPLTSASVAANRTQALQAPLDAPATIADHPVLERTLARAVDKGFVPANQLPAVRERVLALSDRYNFAPDDFARLTLMESGGMNPQASNGRCHGIIQFCEGANRGAASVGLQANPRSILGMGLLQQLDLVDRYFANVGLQPGGPRLQLDDLYLAVLTPAARSEQRRDAPLDIPGPQASLLHVNRDRRAPITRNSILEGLHSLTEQVLQLSRRSGTRLYAELAGPTLPRP